MKYVVSEDFAPEERQCSSRGVSGVAAIPTPCCPLLSQQLTGWVAAHPGLHTLGSSAAVPEQGEGPDD